MSLFHPPKKPVTHPPQGVCQTLKYAMAQTHYHGAQEQEQAREPLKSHGADGGVLDRIPDCGTPVSKEQLGGSASPPQRRARTHTLMALDGGRALAQPGDGEFALWVDAVHHSQGLALALELLSVGEHLSHSLVLVIIGSMLFIGAW